MGIIKKLGELGVLVLIIITVTTLVTGCLNKSEITQNETAVNVPVSTITPIATPTPTPIPKQLKAMHFEGMGRNYTDEFYLNEGLVEFDLRMYGKVWLVDIGEKRIIPIVQGDFDGHKAIYLEHSGNYRLNIDASWWNIVVLN